MKTHHLAPGLLALALAACQTAETDRDLFLKADTNKDGKLSLSEVCELGYPRLYGRFDANGDGRVTFAEAKARQPDFDEKLFTERDLNRDGTVTYEEYVKVAEDKGGMAEAFALVDTNRDAQIDKAEAQVYAASLEATRKR